MRMTFFKKAAKKTVLQGLSAWFLYQIFSLLNSSIPEESNSLSNICLEKFLYRIGIPAIATFGFEELVSKLYGNEIDKELAGINLLVVLIATSCSAALPAMKMENMVPLGLYIMGIYYRYFAEGEGFFPPQSEDNLQPSPSHYRLDR
jgi:Kef-type K+ transport system membrane component KefB